VTIGIRITLPGLTEGQFDAVHDRINPERLAPPGLVFHSSGPVEGGWGIVDFWESRGDFEAFQGRIQEGMAAAGVAPAGPPAVEEFPVHEVIRS
jgi:hypothetical protein